MAGWTLSAANGHVKNVAALARAKDPYPLHQTNQLFRNMGKGRFQEVTEAAGAVFELSEVSRGAAFGDVDNDGDTDVLVLNNSGQARLLTNQVGSGNHWMGLRLGRPAFGHETCWAPEWLSCYPRARTLWRRVRADGSYASANDPRVLVGLGKATQVEAVRVYWPGGEAEEWKQLPINTYSNLLQGSGTRLSLPSERR